MAIYKVQKSKILCFSLFHHHMLIVPSGFELCWINYCYKEWLNLGSAMQSLVAPTQDIVFDIETALEMQLGVKPLPFPGMDSKSCITIVTFLFV